MPESQNDWTATKPTEPGFYDLRIVSDGKVLKENLNVKLNPWDFEPKGYVHHSDNIRFRKVCKIPQ